MNILIVEDETIPANFLKKMLTEEGYNVIGIEKTGKGAIESARHLKPDIILMDIMLKDAISGVDAAVHIYNENSDIKIIFLTAYSEKDMVTRASDAHAYGYFLKPYHREEIVVNLQLIATQHSEKSKEIPDSNVLELADGYTYHLRHKKLSYKNSEILLTPKESQVVDCLVKEKYIIVDFETLSHAIWGAKKSPQTLRSLIHRLREKTSQNIIVNVNRMGYKIGLKEQ